MSSPGPFARRSSSARLWPLSRPQTCASLSALALFTLWLQVGHGGLTLLLLSTLVGAAAVGPPERSGVDHVVRTIRFALRSRWTHVEARRCEDTWDVTARGHCEVALYGLRHRGRLDLTGEDIALEEEIAELLERAALTETAQQLSWHLQVGEQHSAVTLALPRGLAPSPRWRRLEDPSEREDAALGVPSGWLFERWHYLRSDTDVAVVFMVVSSPQEMGASVLRELFPYGVAREASIVLRVESAQRASALAGRQSHRWRTNLALASLGGFRERATYEEASRTLHDREGAVARGRALLEVGIVLVLRATTHALLEEKVRRLRSDARRFGVRLERGNGRQALWYAAALPGSPGWKYL